MTDMRVYCLTFVSTFAIVYAVMTLAGCESPVEPDEVIIEHSDCLDKALRLVSCEG